MNEYREELIGILKSSAHPSRLNILLSLLNEPKVFQDLKTEVNLEKSTLSTHLNRLIQASLVEKYAHGVYKMTPNGTELMENLAILLENIHERQRTEREAKIRRRITESFLNRPRT